MPLLPMWLLAWGLGLVTVGSVLGLAMVSGWFITMAGVVGVGASFNYLVPSALIRTFAIGRTLGRYGDLLVSHQTIFELLKKLRVAFFYRFSALSSMQKQQLGSSVAQQRLVKDIDTLDAFVLSVISPWLMAAFAVVVVAIVVGLLVGWVFATPLVGVGLLVVAVAYPDLAKRLSLADERRQVMLLDHLPVLTQLVLWRQWRPLTTKLLAMDDASTQLLALADARKRWTVLLLQWLLVAVVLLVVIFGGQKAQSGLEVARLLAVVLGLFVLGEVAATAIDPLALGRAMVAKERLQTLLTDTTQKIPLPPLGDCQLRVQDVFAKQPNAIVGAACVNACVSKGRPLVIYGVSGGGKSTLLSVLAGELSPTKGQALLNADGTVFATQTIDWQGQLGFLGQTVDIFNQTLKDNLRLANQQASDEALWEVLALVGLDAWARQQPKGLLTRLGEYGLHVSGGQARRIALARLLLSPKKVLLLDEPFAGLDARTRERLWQMLVHRQADGLLVVVSHHDDIINKNDIDTLVIGDPSPF